MRSMREHIHRLHFLHAICHVESLQVASLCSRVAAYVYDALRMGTQDGLDNVGVHTCTWWVGDDYIRTSVLGNELVVENILHVASIELGVGDVVDIRVDLSVFDSLRHILDADNLTSLTSHEVGNSTRTGVELVNGLVAGELCKIA